MATIQAPTLPQMIELSPEEERAHFDALAQKYLEMTGAEFLRRLDSGELDDMVDDPANHRWVVYLAALSHGVR